MSELTYAQKMENLLPVIKEFIKGKRVQYYDEHFKVWVDTDEPRFSATLKYRVAPRQFVMSLSNDGILVKIREVGNREFSYHFTNLAIAEELYLVPSESVPENTIIDFYADPEEEEEKEL